MPGSSSAWGIDVGVTSLKAIKLRKEGGGGVAVEAFDVVEHEHFLTEPDVNRDETIRHTLQQFLERNSLRREAVFVGVPGSSTFARFVKLPPVEPKKVPEIVRFEAMQQIPFPLEQVNWDYQTFSSPDTPEVEVGIFAMKKELVSQVMANFQSTAMIVEGVQMSSLAVYNAAMYDEMTDGKGTVVVDIGAEHTDLVFIDAGRIWLRTINIGGNNFTDAISKSFKVSFTKAEQLKRTAATSKYQKQIYQAMRPVFADLVAEIQRSKGFYDSSHRDSNIDRVVAMGNPVKLPNLQKYIQQELKMEVVRLENFKKAVVDPKIAAGLAEQILSLGGAFGLAVQGLDLASIDTNLLPSDIARQMLWRAKQPWFAAAAAVLVLGLGVSAYAAWSENAKLKESLNSDAAISNQRDLSAYSDLSSKFNAIPDEYATHRNSINNVLNLYAERKIWPQIYEDITSSLPQAKFKTVDEYKKMVATTPVHLQQRLMIKSIIPTYSGNLATLTAGGSTSSTSTPIGAPVTDPAAQAAAGPVQRGFALEISGYTPYRPNDRETSVIVREFVDKLLARAPAPEPAPANGQPAPAAPSAKAYYYIIDKTAGSSTGFLFGSLATVAAQPGGGGRPGLTEAAHGPFWDAYAPSVLGVRVVETTSGGGGLMAPVGAGSPNAIPIDPDTKQPMTDYNAFTVYVRIVMQNIAQ